MNYTSVTTAIIVLTALVSIAGFRNERIIDALIFWPPGITRHRQYYRFITCGFVHAGYAHLIFNMLTLYFFGGAIEMYYQGYLGLQPYYYPLLYAGGLVVSVLPTYFKHRNDDQYRSLGASGAVSAVLFAFILIKPWVTILVFFIPVPAIVYAGLFLGYSIYMSRKGGDHINHDAHFYGALFGVLFTIVARPGVIQTFLTELKHPQFNF